MPKAENPHAPQPADQSFVISAGDLGSNFPSDFPDSSIRFDITGKTKTIDLPDGGQIITAPGQDVTVTNLDNDASVTLNITGTTHTTVLDDGSTLYEVDGRNLLADPFINDGGPGLVLATGHFSYILGPAEPGITPPLVQPLEGQGQVVNVFDLLV